MGRIVRRWTAALIVGLVAGASVDAVLLDEPATVSEIPRSVPAMFSPGSGGGGRIPDDTGDSGTVDGGDTDSDDADDGRDDDQHDDDGADDAADQLADQIADEVVDETNAILGELDRARRACQEYTAESAAHRVAEAYHGEGAVHLSGVSRNTSVALTSAISSGDEVYAAAAAARSARQSALRQEHRIGTTRAAGDPVRLSDGSFLFHLPLPVITHWGITVDLSLHYDQKRPHRSPFGTGWWWVGAQRVVPGTDPAVDLTPVLTPVETAVGAGRSALREAETAAFPDLPQWRSVADAADFTGLIAALNTAREELDRLRAEAEDLAATIPPAIAERPDVQTVQDALNATITAFDREISASSVAIDAVRGFLEEYGSASSAIERAADWLVGARDERAGLRERSAAAAARLAAALPAGRRAEEFAVGTNAAVFVDAVGTAHLFDITDGPWLRSKTRPWWRLRPVGAGWELQGPHETRRFNGNGRLTSISDDAGHAIHFARDRRGRVTVVRDDRGRQRLGVNWADDRCSISVPEIDPTICHLASDTGGDSPTVVRVESPRGDLRFHYDTGLLGEIVRDDGTRTVVVREVGGENRVRAVLDEQGHGDRFTYHGDGRVTLRDADGATSLFRVEDARVVTAELPSGLRREITIGPSGKPKEIRDNRGRREARRYDAEGALWRVEYGDGRWIEIERDSRGRIIRRRSSTGDVTAVRYDDQGRVDVVEDGALFSFDYPSPSFVRIFRDGEELWSVHRGPNGGVASAVRFDGYREEIRSDRLGRPVERVADGTPVERWFYDSAGRLHRHDRDGSRFRYEYGPGGRCTAVFRDGTVVARFTYDATGRVTRIEAADGTVRRNRWSPGGRLLWVRRRDGRVHEIERDAQGRITAIRGDDPRVLHRGSAGRVHRIDTVTGIIELLYGPSGHHEGYVLPTGESVARRLRPDGTVTLQPAGLPTLEITPPPPPVPAGAGAGGTIQERDRLGRPLVAAYPDGSESRWVYRDHGRRVAFTDRRGAIHRFLYDYHGRVVEYEAPDGFWVRWTYSPASIVERRADGTTLRYHLDPAGNVGSITDGTIVVEAGPSAEFSAGREVTTRTEEGAVLRVSRFDGADVLRSIDARSHGTVFRSTPTADGRIDRYLYGYRETWYPGDPPGAWRVETSTGVWQVTRSAAGRVDRIVAPDGTETDVEWHATGVPREFTMTGADGGRWIDRFRRDRNRLIREDAAGRTYLTARRDPAARTTVLESDSIRRTRVVDPYQLPVRETIDVVGKPSVVSVHNRDIIGRPQRVQTHAEAAEVYVETVSNQPGRRGTTVRIGGTVDSATVAPLEVAVGRASTAESVQIRVGTATELVVSPETVLVPGTARVMTRRLDPGASVTTVSRFESDGRFRTLDALLAVFDDTGRQVAEQSLDGRVCVVDYDRAGAPIAVSVPADGRLRSVPPSITGTLRNAWRSAGVTQRPPGVPTSTLQRPLPDGQATEGLTRDGLGRIVRVDDTDLGYDETTGFADSIDGGSWSIVRTAAGDPLYVRSEEQDRTWLAATRRIVVSGTEVTLRAWVSAPRDSRNAPPRFHPGTRSTGDPATEPQQGNQKLALEVLVDGRLRAVVDAAHLTIPVSDLRGTTRATLVIDRRTGAHRYQVDPASSPVAAFMPTERSAKLYPTGVPYRSVVYGMWDLSDSGVLVGRNRVLLPTMGIFSTRDPELHHLDWWGYAAGDPINMVDPAGRRFVAARRDLGHFQQEGWWASMPLGTSRDYTVGSSGCVLTSVSNMINTVSGEEVTNPGSLNWFSREGFYQYDALLDTQGAAELLESYTGRHVEAVSIDPKRVDMARVAAALEGDVAQDYVATARIRTWSERADGSVAEYEHTVNVTGFDRDGTPRFLDTSARDRRSLDPREELVRLDVYAVSGCRSY